MTIEQKAECRKIVQDLGGAKAVFLGLRDFTERVQLMESRRKELTQKYPDKWVAMHNGDIEVADSIEGVLAILDEKGISRKEVVIEFLTTKPRHLIL